MSKYETISSEINSYSYNSGKTHICIFILNQSLPILKSSFYLISVTIIISFNTRFVKYGEVLRTWGGVFLLSDFALCFHPFTDLSLLPCPLYYRYHLLILPDFCLCWTASLE